MKNNADKHIRLLNWAEQPAFYHDIDVFVLPSREHDPFGLVAAEAMACGVPTIVTDACGIARHIDNNEAIVVAADDVTALRAAIAELQHDAKKRRSIAQNGIKAAIERFSKEKMIEQYLHLQ